jgi:ADP-heptose:LPS heptosyltransferase
MLEFARWAPALRAREQADLVLDFQGLLRSALLARLCRGRRTRILGLSDAREGARLFYDEIVDVSHARHAVDRYLVLASCAIGAAPAFAEPALEWPLPAGTPVAGVGEERFILLHPFARGAGKSLAAAEIAAFCHALAPHRVIVAGRTETPLEPLANALDLLNRTTLLELIWLLRRAAFVVSVDSGPMHIAAALTPRLVSIHTWSDPERVGPYRDDAWILARGRLWQRGREHAGELTPDVEALARWVAVRVTA